MGDSGIYRKARKGREGGAGRIGGRKAVGGGRKSGVDALGRLERIRTAVVFLFAFSSVVSAPLDFHFTSHAKRRAVERGITEPLFIEVVTNCDHRKRQYRGTHGGFVYLFSKQFEQRQLHIVAERYKQECFFVTGYWT